jgi:hypothetical protein
LPDLATKKKRCRTVQVLPPTSGAFVLTSEPFIKEKISSKKVDEKVVVAHCEQRIEICHKSPVKRGRKSSKLTLGSKKQKSKKIVKDFISVQETESQSYSCSGRVHSYYVLN